ncbi:homeodomain-interacting protein kinase 1-like [Nelusetta ayraudi]|uniref:homeodomain-interacting protein kinase 1-like n=1 Tax=Nelusetta ayraudi TaxID=303726 RepID=UPI003F712E52
MAADLYDLPSKEFSLERVIAEGSFGIVRMCRRRSNNELLAAKIPKNSICTPIEMLCMEALMKLKFDQRNIVKYFGTFKLFHQRVMVFEWLDMNLDQYLVRASPLPLNEIRAIVQQVATALDALASIGLIHGDLHPSNIMVSKHLPEPLKVKVIDFGTSFSASKAEPVMSLQIISFRAPELFLGLPFTEAIDLWSLAVVLCFIISESLPFPGQTHYEVLTSMIKILGQPPDRLLDRGFKTKRYFVKTPFNTWRLKTPCEFSDDNVFTTETRKFTSLDELKELSVSKRYQADPDEWSQCIELVKAMLQISDSDRITPGKVLTHPFIATLTLNTVSVLPTSHENTSLLYSEENKVGDISCRAADTPTDHDTMFFNRDNLSPFPTFRPRMTVVHPFQHENVLQPQDQVSLQTSADIMPESPSCLDGGTCWLATPAISLTEDDTSRVQPEVCSPPPTIRPKVIVVHPATHCGKLQKEGFDGADCLLPRLSSSPESKSNIESFGTSRTLKKQSYGS